MPVEGGRGDLQALGDFGHGDLPILRLRSSGDIKRKWSSDPIEPNDELASGGYFYFALIYAG